MSYLAEAWVNAQKVGSSSRRHTLRVIAHYFNDEEGFAWPSTKALAAKTEQSIATVERNLTALEADGFIRREIVRYGADGGAKRRIYLNLDTPRVEAQLRIKRTPRPRKVAAGATNLAGETSPHFEGTLPEASESPPTAFGSPQFEGQVPSSCGSGPLNLRQSDSLGKNINQDSSEPNGSAPRGGAAGRDFRKELFGRGVRTVRDLTGRADLGCRSLIGVWLKLASDEAVTVLAAIDEAVVAEVIEPVAWIEARLKRRRAEAPPAAARAVAAVVASERMAEARRMVERGEWPIGGSVFVAADSPEGAAWERHFARFGRKARWTDCGRSGLGWSMPSRTPPAEMATADEGDRR